MATQELMSRYINHEKIGQGAYGTVYKAFDRIANQFVAMKKIPLKKEEEGIPPTALREIALLRELSQHPNIVQLQFVGQHGENLYLVFEFVDEDMKHYLDERRRKNIFLEDQIVKRLVYQLLKGIEFCHSRRVLHRDLKPANLLIDSSATLKIADFGLAREYSFRNNPYTHEVITLWYRAPEILLGCDHYSTPVDIWSIGCIFAELALNKPMFPADSEIDQLFRIFQVLGTPNESNWPGVTSFKHYKMTFPNWKTNNMRQQIPEERLSNEGFDLLSQMLVYEPSKRISAKDALKHRYFSDL